MRSRHAQHRRATRPAYSPGKCCGCHRLRMRLQVTVPEPVHEAMTGVSDWAVYVSSTRRHQVNRKPDRPSPLRGLATPPRRPTPGIPAPRPVRHARHVSSCPRRCCGYACAHLQPVLPNEPWVPACDYHMHSSHVRGRLPAVSGHTASTATPHRFPIVTVACIARTVTCMAHTARDCGCDRLPTVTEHTRPPAACAPFTSICDCVLR